MILYTSGTTGLPKGALISHRAELARLQPSRIDTDMQPDDSFVAWAPMFHMVSTEHALQLLCLGSKVIVVDGADTDRLVHLIAAGILYLASDAASFVTGAELVIDGGYTAR